VNMTDDIHERASRPSDGSRKPEIRDAVPTAILREIRKRRRLAYKLHAAGPCVFTLRDAAVLRERRNRRGER